MSSAMMMERSGLGMTGMSYPGVGTPTVGGPTGVPTVPNFLMVPRCTVKVEKCQGGLKITCSSDDKMACSMVQNLCSMLQGGMCTCYCTLNGMTVCTCNLTMGMCRCEMTPDGVCLTCTSGDSKCCEMLQACCDCLSSCLQAGCTCCVMLNNTPLCCSTCEPSKSSGKPKSSK